MFLLVAVIGAGAAGLVSGRELMREGHEVVIYEQSSHVGGVWVYQSETEDDPLGVAPRKSIFSSLYDSLRTNLPRDLMAFLDYKFDSSGGGEDTWARYPHHTLVLEYLSNFATDYGLREHINFEQKVTRVEQEESGCWVVEAHLGVKVFDAVMICNGHYSKPRVPEILGIADFRGKIMHSHNYRNSEEFRDKRVVVFGTAASGVDISREISLVAEKVFWCGDSFSWPVQENSHGISLYPCPIALEGRDVLFEKARVEDVDVFLFCTGYEYGFPFLDNHAVSVDDNWVNPLYQEIISPSMPNVGFIGLPFLVVPFPLFEIQARWFARLLAGRFRLPEKQAMFQQITNHHRQLIQSEVHQRHFHRLADKQVAYINDLSAQCGEPPLPEWFGKLTLEAQKARISDPDNFRDNPMTYTGPTVVPI